MSDFLENLSLTGDDSFTATTQLNKEQTEKLRILFTLYEDNTQQVPKKAIKKFLERAFQEQKGLPLNVPISYCTKRFFLLNQFQTFLHFLDFLGQIMIAT